MVFHQKPKAVREGSKQITNRELKVRQHDRLKIVIESILAMSDIFAVSQFPNEDLELLWIDNPVFRDSRFGVFRFLQNQIPFSILHSITQNLDYEIRLIEFAISFPSLGESGRGDEHQIRLTVLAKSNPKWHGSVKHFSEFMPPNEPFQRDEQLRGDRLMKWGWHRQNLNLAIGELNEMVSGDVEIFVFCPILAARE